MPTRVRHSLQAHVLCTTPPPAASVHTRTLTGSTGAPGVSGVKMFLSISFLPFLLFTTEFVRGRAASFFNLSYLPVSKKSCWVQSTFSKTCQTLKFRTAFQISNPLQQAPELPSNKVTGTKWSILKGAGDDRGSSENCFPFGYSRNSGFYG